MFRLLDKYRKEVIPQMMQRFGYNAKSDISGKARYKNPMAVPRIEKVIVNTSFGRLVTGKTGEEQKKISEAILEDMSLICGQKPVLTKAKKSIASFKTRQGMFIGAVITLRKKRMYDFLERLIYIALPRTRDFRGIEQNSFDKKGNLTYGVKEHIVFPEISPEKVKNIFGFEVTVVTTAKKREEGVEFLRMMGFPIKKE